MAINIKGTLNIGSGSTGGSSGPIDLTTAFTAVTRPSLGSYDSFSYHGFSISMNDTHLVVGAYGAAESYAKRNAGAVAIYSLSDAVNTKILKGGSLNQQYGIQVEVSGSTMNVWTSTNKITYTLDASGNTTYTSNTSSSLTLPNGTQTLTATSTSYSAVSESGIITVTDTATSQTKYTIDATAIGPNVYIIMNDNYLVAKSSASNSSTGYDYALRIYALT